LVAVTRQAPVLGGPGACRSPHEWTHRTRQDAEKRIDELRRERATVEEGLAGARVAARDDLIAGRKPGARLTERSERPELIDEALAELRDRIATGDETEARKRRVVVIERAQRLTSERRVLAAAVDRALAELATSFRAYRDSVRGTVGSVVQAGGDTVPLGKVSLNGGVSDGLVKAVLASTGDMDMVRALGIQTSNRPRHSSPLAAGEDRVLRSLEVELLRVKATSPNRLMARDAKQELERITQEN
jgi:hypothetical protein